MGIFSYTNARGYNNLLETCAYVLKQSNVKFTRTRLKKSLESNVNYPSLLSLNECLTSYSIASVAIRKGNYSYADFETPFICSIQKNTWPTSRFTVVSNVEATIITYLDPETNEKIQITNDEFVKMDKEVILLLDTSNAKDEIEFLRNKKAENITSLLTNLPFSLALVVLLTTVCILFMQAIFISALVGALFLLTSFVGILICAMLMWHDVDSHQPFIKDVCGMLGKKSNCDAVLNSSQSTFMGISWSVWGFTYFATFFISQIIFLRHGSNIFLWSIFSLLLSPYLLFSIYYQARVVKQWCPLCMGIQLLILLNASAGAIFLSLNEYHIQIDFYQLFIILFLGLLFLTLLYFSIPFMKQAIEADSYKVQWKRLHYNPIVFNAILENNNSVLDPENNVGLIIGNEDAQNEIIKVCNPYCEPCSKAHPILDEIIHTTII